MNSVPLNAYLVVAAALFCFGLYGSLTRRNAVGILMGVELMLNAVNINLVAFWRYLTPEHLGGQVFAVFIIALAAAEAAIGLALFIAIYRTRDTVNVEDINLMKW
ncbi:MAG: NADH-quinone oxidoreductase subunit NuoK [Anaerolineae bacterium]|nr:NADH-quinone oxidoreductase subunit NuoK [Anaerolineae bacterium]